MTLTSEDVSMDISVTSPGGGASLPHLAEMYPGAITTIIAVRRSTVNSVNGVCLTQTLISNYLLGRLRKRYGITG